MFTKPLNYIITKEYLTYLLYRAISLGFMVVALNYFLFESKIGNLFTNLLFFGVSVFFSVLHLRLKPALSQCLDECSFVVSFSIAVGNITAFMGTVLFLVYMLSGRDVEMVNLLYLIGVGIVFGIAYFSRCKKKFQKTDSDATSA